VEQIMAHELKYYKEIESHGHLWRVEILQETEDTLTPTEIGPVLQGLRLVVQGDQADVDTPIVKTSLEMTFVDAPDHEEERKCGCWEEFYTSSATEYQVKLYKDGGIEWSGYVTPDSFSEDLRYRGSVSIIARDNLGALQDYTCDAVAIADEEGKIEIYRLVSRALNATGIIALDIILNDSLMYPDATRSWPVGNAGGEYRLSDVLPWQVIDANALSDLNWYEALEKVLYSVGAVLRYVGGNKLTLCAIKDIGLGVADFWFDVPTRPVQFVAHGRRELSPAVKEIKEIIEFEKPDSDKAKENAISVTSYGEQAGLRINRVQINLSAGSEIGEVVQSGEAQTIVHGYAMTKQNGGTIAPSASRLLDISRYTKAKGYDSEAYGKWDDPSILYYALGSPERYPVGPRMAVLAPEDTLLNLSVNIDRTVSFFTRYSTIGNTALSSLNWDTMPSLLYQIRIEPFDTYANSTQWYDVSEGKWKASKVDNSKYLANLYMMDQNGRNPAATSIEIKDLSVPFAGRVFFEVVGDKGDNKVVVYVPNYGVYLRLKDFKITAQLAKEFEFTASVKTTTKYNEKNNIRLERSPEFGTNIQLGKAAYLCPNTILTKAAAYRGYETGEFWGFHSEDQGVALPVLIHQQILAYYAKPNNVLTGELVLDGDVPDFRSLWRWGGKDHLLMSGTLNVLTGRMENAVLREFTRYDRMWETWVDNEDINIDYAGEKALLQVYTDIPELTDAYVSNLPSWLSLDIAGPYGDKLNRYELKLYAMENASGKERQAIFRIDTAYVRITQRAAGDYGIDYGKDYS
jgi:hypothetical protein